MSEKFSSEDFNALIDFFKSRNIEPVIAFVYCNAYIYRVLDRIKEEAVFKVNKLEQTTKK